MELRNCPVCGRVFNYVGKNMCPECVRSEDRDFDAVSDYLYRHPNATVAQVHEGTGVREELILRFLRDGRLLVSDGATVGLYCESCGAPIRTGRLCERCANTLTRSVERLTTTPREETPAERPSERERLHIADLVHDRRPKDKS